ncbi:MAG: hypothetical protein DRI44_06280 [Chlamydiae bacterium]|nr:MAG: hypothetical protein DRI44_06280 [Chlamydiota bacterium]
MNRILLCILGTGFLMCVSCAKNHDKKKSEVKLFQEIYNADWKKVFHDSCTQNWKERWTLDGLKAKVRNSAKGMSLLAGPTAGDNSCHAVLWTKQNFKGDIKIEYEYTRLDKATNFVTILYVQATGTGIGQYKKDISKWSGIRNVPFMRTYFDNMNTYHISYAAYGTKNIDPVEDYIRARRYMPLAKKGLKGTELKPDYFRTGFFKTEVPHKITVIKKGKDLFMHIRNDEKELLCHWENQSLPPIDGGRIGLRHMYTRKARYSNFRIYKHKKE